MFDRYDVFGHAALDTISAVTQGPEIQELRCQQVLVVTMELCIVFVLCYSQSRPLMELKRFPPPYGVYQAWDWHNGYRIS